MSIRISALKMQLTLSAQVERTCNFKILSLRATVCVFSFWKVSILSKRKTHIDKWRTCWFSGKLEMGETTYIWRTLTSLSKLLIASAVAGRLLPLLMVACANQRKHISGDFCFRNEPFLWIPKCPSSVPWAETYYSVFTFHSCGKTEMQQLFGQF